VTTGHPVYRAVTAITGCFRTSEYTHAYFRISNYLQFMASKEYNPLIAIQIALAGEAHKVWGE
jgi:transposase